MFKLVKLIVAVVGLGAFVWWGATARLGDRTLFGHIAAIGHSKESQELVRGTKQKVSDLKRRIGADALAGKPEPAADEKTAKRPPAPGSEAPAAPPQERLTHTDRKEMRKLIDSARTKIAKHTGTSTN